MGTEAQPSNSPDKQVIYLVPRQFRFLRVLSAIMTVLGAIAFLLGLLSFLAAIADHHDSEITGFNLADFGLRYLLAGFLSVAFGEALSCFVAIEHNTRQSAANTGYLVAKEKLG